MDDVVVALMRTLSSLRSGRIWGYVLAPALVSLILWIALAIYGLWWLLNVWHGRRPTKKIHRR